VKKKAADSALRRFPMVDGGLGSWLAWHGYEAHEGGAWWSTLDAWSRGARRKAVKSGARDWRLSRKRRGTGLDVAAMWDKGATRTWRRQLHGLRVEQRWRAVDSTGAR
jgi:hypothetical protein